MTGGGEFMIDYMRMVAESLLRAIHGNLLSIIRHGNVDTDSLVCNPGKAYTGSSFVTCKVYTFCYGFQAYDETVLQVPEANPKLTVDGSEPISSAGPFALRSPSTSSSPSSRAMPHWRSIPWPISMAWRVRFCTWKMRQTSGRLCPISTN